jgi:hypothetical protein
MASLNRGLKDQEGNSPVAENFVEKVLNYLLNVILNG